MIYFNNDYSEGCLPEIMEKLCATNMEQTPGYGVDHYCIDAAEKIKKLCASDCANVHFLVGGTQTNLTVIAAALLPYQAVISAVSGHINVHETGAIEATGHKVIGLASDDGKITADQVEQEARSQSETMDAEHTVQPAMVYISNPTEYGTIYTLSELEALSAVCKKWGLSLFVDGARLGYGLTAGGNDVTLADMARLCDVFYIGGTKVGALFGEAVVITNPAINRDFRYMIKQRGGMLAKGRLLGLQFETLLKDGLYEEIAGKAVKQAMRLKEAFLEKGYPLLYDSYTNQQFPIMAKCQLEQLKEKYSFELWCKMDEEYSAVRFCTSWATKDEDIDTLLKDLEDLA